MTREPDHPTRFAVGSLVRARGREWVVLPESRDDLLMLRPLGGTDAEVSGVYLPIETVEPATFDPPDPSRTGDHRSCRLLRDAVRLGFRSSAGPFRSFARLGFDPRPYQLVPLLMALKLEPVRLLIADDVGIGKTIEAGLIARELLDRGEIGRLAVLCPPHLAEQWQAELSGKFHIEAELVLAGTAARLERHCAVGQSLFDVHPHVVVSMDFIKSERRRLEFRRCCPELVIVDEAHTCAPGLVGRGGRHQRHELVRDLATAPGRHLILVTATPHSGNEAAFRSLLGLLSSALADLPEDLTGPHHEAERRRLAAHLVQRRRPDIEHYLQADTPFPRREEKEESYKLSVEYRRLFDRVLEYARETVRDTEGTKHRQRVRWWSVLALLRALASSPAAAAATLESRAAAADTTSEEEADDVGRRTVLDVDIEDGELSDVVPGSDPGDEPGEEAPASSNGRRLRELARAARQLEGKQDAKLARVGELVASLVKDGFRPLVFCRFIATAAYVAAHLRGKLGKSAEVEAVTGMLPPEEREARILQLAVAASEGKRAPVLVATDCLSEGINLQEHFDAVLHYDLSWNPTRHEQREGRVDRFGQPREVVRVLTYYGLDNQIDGIVLDVLLRKHQKIRSSLGISVPVPVDTSAVVEAVLEGLLLRESSSKAPGDPKQLLFFEELFRPDKEKLHREWEAVADREKRSRTVFAQASIKVGEVARELEAARQAVGSSSDVERFVAEALELHGGRVSRNGCVVLDVREVPRGLRDAMDLDGKVDVQFELPLSEGRRYLHRTAPAVEGLASYVLDTALDPLADGKARRCGAVRTAGVSRRTTLLLIRFRFHIVEKRGESESPLLAEDVQLLAFEGPPENPVWLEPAAAEGLLGAQPAGNVAPADAASFVGIVVSGLDGLRPRMEKLARERGQGILDAHRRVRAEARWKGVAYRVEPKLPADLLGAWVFLPALVGDRAMK